MLSYLHINNNEFDFYQIKRFLLWYCTVFAEQEGVAQILGALGASAGIDRLSALTQKMIEFCGHVEDMTN